MPATSYPPFPAGRGHPQTPGGLMLDWITARIDAILRWIILR